MIYDSTKQASLLTQQLKVFSRQQADVTETIDLNQLIAESQEIINRVLSKHNRLKLQLEEKPIFILAGRNHIQQILLNLAMNARDTMDRNSTFTLQTEFVSKIESNRANQGSLAKLIISDNGQGMDEQVKLNMFEPFFTTKDPGKNSGLGLATVYWIVEQYKGNIECESILGKGTSFTITFPAMPSEAPTNFIH